MTKQKRIIFVIEDILQEDRIKDMEVLDLLNAICESVIEKGVYNNWYLEELKKVGK